MSKRILRHKISESTLPLPPILGTVKQSAVVSPERKWGKTAKVSF